MTSLNILNNIKTKKIRVGRGIGSGKGKTSGRGVKGQKKNKSELSTIVAEILAKKANEKNIKKIYFDRGIYKYHGRVKIFAETLRKNGMEL